MEDADVAETTIGERCKEARRRAKLSQDNLLQILKDDLKKDQDRKGPPRMASLTRRTIVRYESGENDKDIPGWYIKALAKHTGTDGAWLLFGTESPAHSKLERIREILDEPMGSVSRMHPAEVAAKQFPPVDEDRLPPGEDERKPDEGTGTG